MLNKNKFVQSNERLKGRDWNDKDVKRSKEMANKIDQVMKRREQLRRLEEYVGGRPKTINPCVYALPTQAWLWHHRLSHLNNDTINMLSKNDIVKGLPKLKFVKDQLCLSCEIGTDRGTSFLNKTLHAYFKEEGIEHQTFTPRTPKKNGIVERQNRTMVEAARTMRSASKLPLFLWAKAITTACYTQNRSIIIPRHENTPYHIINERKPSLKHHHIFGCTCYLVRDGENLDKMKEKGDPCIFVGYSTTSNVSKSPALSDNSTQQDTQPTVNVQPTTEPITLTTNVNAEENHTNQVADAQFVPYEFYNPFCTPVQEVAESSSYNTRRQLAIDPEMCMFALTMSTAEPKNIKEERADHAWIEKVYRLRKALYGLKQAPRAWTSDTPILKSIGTPIATKPKLDVDPSGLPIDQPKYRSMIGSLMYLTSSRPDIVQAVCYCAHYQARLTEKHLKDVKRIFLYLKGTINMGLRYPKDSGFKLTAFSDADHAECLDARKSTSGVIQFLGENLVSWMSKKQDCTTMSTAKTKYVALSASYAQVMWMRIQPKDYGFNYNKISLYCDSESKYQLADMFMKSLSQDRFEYLVRRIVDVYPNAMEMWKAIKKLKQGESINVPYIETNLYWEFRKFISRDVESLDSYYSWFEKMMNELVKNQFEVTNYQVNV
nr:copia protein [Tanacetum cinerariifolium]